jgi:predicted metalloprotease
MELGDREESQNVEDDRGRGRTGLMLGGGGIVIVLIALFLGVDPQKILALLNQQQGPDAGAQVDNGPKDPAEEKIAHFAKVVFGDTERVWNAQFREMGKVYQEPTLVLYTGQVESACGEASSAVGPFYCSGDSKVYLDLSFFHEMDTKLHATGEFARAYVIAHEVGHHVQRLLGYSRRADQLRASGGRRAASQVSVRLELQADYFAGVWAYHAQQQFKNFLQEGDIESALNAANQIGDDKLQKQGTGVVRPDSFTHGTSRQRVRWFTQGFKTGDVGQAKMLFDLDYDNL